MDLIFTDEALDDLEYIHEFLQSAEVHQVDEIVGNIIATTRQLLIFPKSGRPVRKSDLWGDVRDFFGRRYCFRYALFGGHIYILRIWHQRENERNET